MVSLLLSFVLASTAAAADEVSLGKLAVSPNSFKGQMVTADASMMMIVAQKMLSQCKGKSRAVMILPPMANGTMAVPGTLQYVVSPASVEAVEAVEPAAAPAVE